MRILPILFYRPYLVASNAGRQVRIVNVVGKRRRIFFEFIQSAAERAEPKDIRIGTIFEQAPDFGEIDAVRVVRVRLVARKFTGAFIENI